MYFGPLPMFSSRLQEKTRRDFLKLSAAGVFAPALSGWLPVMADAAPCRPLITLGQGAYNAQLGQGILGQPTAYVPGQSIRNFIRYLSP